VSSGLAPVSPLRPTAESTGVDRIFDEMAVRRDSAVT